MSKESHGFNPEVATEIGVNCAIILQHLTFLHKSLLGNKEAWDGGRFWIKKSVTAFIKTYPYFSPKEIRGALEKMEKLDLIVSQQSISPDKSDKSKGYSVQFQGFEIMQIVEGERQIDPFAKRASAFAKKDKSHLPFCTNDKDYNSYTNKKITGEKSPSLSESDLPTLPAKQKEEYTSDFTAFWKQYQLNKGSKKKAADIWGRLTEKEKDAATTALPQYKADTAVENKPGKDWKPLRCHAEVYLRNRRWEAYEDALNEKMGTDVETPFDENYRKYIETAKTHFPNVLAKNAHLSKAEFIIYKKGMPEFARLGDKMQWEIFMNSHKFWNEEHEASKPFSTVWAYNIHRLNERMQMCFTI